MIERVIVVPVKGTELSKTRLAELPASVTFRRKLALAFALDTVSAVLAADGVQQVIVVTNDVESTDALASLATSVPGGAEVTVVADPGSGLNAAITEGMRAAAIVNPRALVVVMTADLPGLVAEDLNEALELAEAWPLSFVADASGEGTTTIAVHPGRGSVRPLFGGSSALKHVKAGFVPLQLRAGSSLRNDIDTPEDIERGRSGFGRYTTALLSNA